jgi:hypothetical protein
MLKADLVDVGSIGLLKLTVMGEYPMTPVSPVAGVEPTTVARVVSY